MDKKIKVYMDTQIKNGNGYVSVHCDEPEQGIHYSKLMTCNGVDDARDVYGYMLGMAAKFVMPFWSMDYDVRFVVSDKEALEAFKASELAKLGECSVSEENPARVSLKDSEKYFDREIRTLNNFDIAKDLVRQGMPMMIPHQRFMYPLRPFSYIDAMFNGPIGFGGIFGGGMPPFMLEDHGFKRGHHGRPHGCVKPEINEIPAVEKHSEEPQPKKAFDVSSLNELDDETKMAIIKSLQDSLDKKG